MCIFTRLHDLSSYKKATAQEFSIFRSDRKSKAVRDCSFTLPLGPPIWITNALQRRGLCCETPPVIPSPPVILCWFWNTEVSVRIFDLIIDELIEPQKKSVFPPKSFRFNSSCDCSTDSCICFFYVDKKSTMWPIVLYLICSFYNSRCSNLHNDTNSTHVSLLRDAHSPLCPHLVLKRDIFTPCLSKAFSLFSILCKEAFGFGPVAGRCDGVPQQHELHLRLRRVGPRCRGLSTRTVQGAPACFKQNTI